MKKFHVILGVLAMAGAANGATEGDINGDQDVDFADFSALAASFTGTITAPASDTPEEGDVHLEIDLTDGGKMTLQPNNANLVGYSIRSPDSQLVPDPDGLCSPYIFCPWFDTPFEITRGIPGTTMMLSDDLVLDISFAGDRAQAANVVFQYTRAGEGTLVDGMVHIVPEPATMVLLAAVGWLVLPRRRRSA